MAQHLSVIQQERRASRRNLINRKNKSILRTRIKTIRTAITNKNREEAEKLLPEIFSTIDKSVKKGTIHRRTGDRYKSRLSRQVEMINPSPSK